MTLRAAVFASGRGSNFRVLADRASSGRGRAPAGVAKPLWEVSLLITDREDAPVLELAAERGIQREVVPPTGGAVDFAARLLEPLETAAIDFVLLAGYLRLVPSGIVRRYHGRMLNLHPALLPSFGGQGMYGRRVHEAVIEAGARISGATVHFVDESYDRGSILAQWPVPVLPDDTPDALAARVQEVEHRLYPAAADGLARGLTRGTSATPLPAAEGHFHLAPELPHPDAGVHPSG